MLNKPMQIKCITEGALEQSPQTLADFLTKHGNFNAISITFRMFLKQYE